jgi:hypothetical protein
MQAHGRFIFMIQRVSLEVKEVDGIFTPYGLYLVIDDAEQDQQ